MKISNSWAAVQTPTAPGAIRLSLHRRFDPVTSASVSSVTAQSIYWTLKRHFEGLTNKYRKVPFKFSDTL